MLGLKREAEEMPMQIIPVAANVIMIRFECGAVIRIREASVGNRIGSIELDEDFKWGEMEEFTKLEDFQQKAILKKEVK